MTPHFFAIVTPTLQRESLIQACESVSDQTYTNWIHSVVCDCTMGNFRTDLANKIAHPHRVISVCGEHHNNGGNYCRHNQWDRFEADWWIYLDDDVYLSDVNILADMANVLVDLPKEIGYCVFPITRLGGVFFSDPPRNCHTDTLNLVMRKEYAQWPNTTAYGSDGVLVDDLMARGISYASFPNFRPIGVIPKISFCRPDGA